MHNHPQRKQRRVMDKSIFLGSATCESLWLLAVALVIAVVVVVLAVLVVVILFQYSDMSVKLEEIKAKHEWFPELTSPSSKASLLAT